MNKANLMILKFILSSSTTPDYTYLLRESCTFDKYIITIAFHNDFDCYPINHSIDDISKPFYEANHGIKIIQVEFLVFWLQCNGCIS